MAGVVHVLPRDMTRGAQRHARMLCDGLEGFAPQVVVALYGPDRGVAKPDVLLCPDVQGRPSLGARLTALIRLLVLVHRVHPDLVVVHGSEPLWHAAPIVTSRRLVYHRIGVSHLGLPSGLRSRIRNWSHRLLVHRPGLVVAVSEDVARELTDRFGLPGDRIRVIPNGRDPDHFRPRLSSAGAAVPVLGFIGHLTRTKHPELFVRVVTRAAMRVPCSGLMVGDGPMRSGLTDACQALPVDLVGPSTEVSILLRSMDVFIFCSESEGEGMPGVLIEAALSGLPIVTTDVPGARDVVEHGVTGFVVPEADEEAIVESVLALLRDPAMRERFGRVARDRAARTLSISACVKAWRCALADQIRAAGR